MPGRHRNCPLTRGKSLDGPCVPEVEGPAGPAAASDQLSLIRALFGISRLPGSPSGRHVPFSVGCTQLLSWAASGPGLRIATSAGVPADAPSKEKNVNGPLPPTTAT